MSNIDQLQIIKEEISNKIVNHILLSIEQVMYRKESIIEIVFSKNEVDTIESIQQNIINFFEELNWKITLFENDKLLDDMLFIYLKEQNNNFFKFKCKFFLPELI